MTRPLKALVLWADNYSTNLGVQVLAQGNARLLRDAFGEDTQIDFQNYSKGDSNIDFGGKSILKDFLFLDRSITKKIEQYDIVVDTGAGDSFTDIYGIKRLVRMFYVQQKVIRKGIPLVLGPQTVGPFNTRLGKFLGKITLKKSNLVQARDSVSYALSAKYGRQAETLSTDVVFALPVPKTEKQYDVLFNVSGLLWDENHHVDYRKYRDNVVKLIEYFQNSGRNIQLITHVIDNPSNDNDSRIVDSINSLLDTSVEAVVPDSLTEARESLAKAKLVIGSRMHACLNALSVGTPSIPWAYSRKFEPLMNDIGWDLIVDLREDASPFSKTVSILTSFSEEDLLEKLATISGEIEKRQSRTVQDLKKLEPQR